MQHREKQEVRQPKLVSADSGRLYDATAYQEIVDQHGVEHHHEKLIPKRNTKGFKRGGKREGGGTVIGKKTNQKNSSSKYSSSTEERRNYPRKNLTFGERKKLGFFGCKQQHSRVIINRISNLDKSFFLPKNKGGKEREGRERGHLKDENYLFEHFDCHTHSCRSSALSVSRLQHPQFSILNSKF